MRITSKQEDDEKTTGNRVVIWAKNLFEHKFEKNKTEVQKLGKIKFRMLYENTGQAADKNG